jgi:hypothetical protein
MTKSEVGFKRVSLETNMDPIVFYKVAGLPWTLWPEDQNRLRGEWYVKAGRKTVRCKSLAEAKQAVIDLAPRPRASSSGRAGRAAGGSSKRRSRAASR